MGAFARLRLYLTRRLTPYLKAWLALAGILIGVGTLYLAESLVFWATSTRVEGTVTGHERYGKSKAYRPVVEYQWGGATYRCESDGQPSVWAGQEPLPVGTKLAVFVSRDGPPVSRLGIPSQWLFGCFCSLPGLLFLVAVVVAVVWGKLGNAVPGNPFEGDDRVK